MTSPAEGLRSAAVLLRQRATAATPGPWRREYPAGPNTGIVAAAGLVVPGVAARQQWPLPEDSNYVVAVHPLVGLALADLLDSLGTMPSMSNTVDFHYALKLARLILAGGGS